MSERTSTQRCFERTEESDGRDRTGPAAWERERERLLELLAQQQRVAQVGLLTSSLAHDVANHANVISGVAQLARRKHDLARYGTAMETVQERCVALCDTMRAFLDFVSRSDSAADRVYALSEIVREAAHLTQPLAQEHGVRLLHTTRSDGRLAGQRRLVLQAAVNLATNAIRATRGGDGCVAIIGSRPRDSVCRLEVRDNGPGIPAEVRERLFRPFATASGPGGHGLGLFIVRQTVRRLGGSILVLSSRVGTTFRIDLPAS